jgi:DNA-binding transcriptional regulator YiaG
MNAGSERSLVSRCRIAATRTPNRLRILPHVTGVSQKMPTTNQFKPLTACQVRAARAMIRMSVCTLAKETQISESSIRRIESTLGVPESVSLDLLMQLQQWFESRGFVFVFDKHGPGVCWPDYMRARKARRRQIVGGSIGGSGDHA